MTEGRQPTAGGVDDARIREATRVLAAGGVVAYPTETVYGLGVDARNERAIESMVECKGREGGRGISVLIADLDMAMPLLAQAPPLAARALVDAFWPGPLTIVLPAAPAVAESLRGPSGGIGLRCSSDPWASALVRCFAGPVTSTSANRSGEPPARSGAEARAAFATDGSVFVLDGGERTGTSVSTVIEFSDGCASIVRAGAIPASSIASVLDRLEESHGKV